MFLCLRIQNFEFDKIVFPTYKSNIIVRYVKWHIGSLRDCRRSRSFFNGFNFGLIVIRPIRFADTWNGDGRKTHCCSVNKSADTYGYNGKNLRYFAGFIGWPEKEKKRLNVEAKKNLRLIGPKLGFPNLVPTFYLLVTLLK